MCWCYAGCVGWLENVVNVLTNDFKRLTIDSTITEKLIPSFNKNKRIKTKDKNICHTSELSLCLSLSYLQSPHGFVFPQENQH